MKPVNTQPLSIVIIVAFALTVVTSRVHAQHHDHHQHQEHKPAEKHEKHDSRGDPYTLDTCIISGMKLGSMGDPVVKNIAGWEVRFCCDACVDPFEKDTATHFKKIDEQMIVDQKPHYPLNTCIVTGMKLGSMGDPFDHIHRNRLVRFCCAGCIPGFEEEPEKFIKKLDKAVIEKQKPEYKLGDICVVSAEGVDDHGEPVERVFANRLVRFCCTGCVRDFRENPTRYLKALAEGKAVGEASGGAHDHEHDDHSHGDHGGHGGHGGHGCSGRGGSGGAGGHDNHGQRQQPRQRRGGCGR